MSFKGRVEKRLICRADGLSVADGAAIRARLGGAHQTGPASCTAPGLRRAWRSDRYLTFRPDKALLVLVVVERSAHLSLFDKIVSAAAGTSLWGR